MGGPSSARSLAQVSARDLDQHRGRSGRRRLGSHAHAGRGDAEARRQPLADVLRARAGEGGGLGRDLTTLPAPRRRVRRAAPAAKRGHERGMGLEQDGEPVEHAGRVVRQPRGVGGEGEGWETHRLAAGHAGERRVGEERVRDRVRHGGPERGAERRRKTERRRARVARERQVEADTPPIIGQQGEGARERQADEVAEWVAPIGPVEMQVDELEARRRLELARAQVDVAGHVGETAAHDDARRAIEVGAQRQERDRRHVGRDPKARALHASRGVERPAPVQAARDAEVGGARPRARVLVEACLDAAEGHDVWGLDETVVEAHAATMHGDVEGGGRRRRGARRGPLAERREHGTHRGRGEDAREERQGMKPGRVPAERHGGPVEGRSAEPEPGRRQDEPLDVDAQALPAERRRRRRRASGRRPARARRRRTSTEAPSAVTVPPSRPDASGRPAARPASTTPSIRTRARPPRRAGSRVPRAFRRPPAARVASTRTGPLSFPVARSCAWNARIVEPASPPTRTAARASVPISPRHGRPRGVRPVRRRKHELAVPAGHALDAHPPLEEVDGDAVEPHRLEGEPWPAATTAETEGPERAVGAELRSGGQCPRVARVAHAAADAGRPRRPAGASGPSAPRSAPSIASATRSRSVAPALRRRARTRALAGAEQHRGAQVERPALGAAPERRVDDGHIGQSEPAHAVAPGEHDTGAGQAKHLHLERRRRGETGGGEDDAAVGLQAGAQAWPVERQSMLAAEKGGNLDARALGSRARRAPRRGRPRGGPSRRAGRAARRDRGRRWRPRARSYG